MPHVIIPWFILSRKGLIGNVKIENTYDAISRTTLETYISSSSFIQKKMYAAIILSLAILTLAQSFAILPSATQRIRAQTRLFISEDNLDKYEHTLAILTFPRNSNNQIANEAILMQAMDQTLKRLSVVIRCQDGLAHRTPIEDLRRYVGEIYSLVWDCNQSLLRTGEFMDADEAWTCFIILFQSYICFLVFFFSVPISIAVSILFFRNSLRTCVFFFSIIDYPFILQ